jgi:type IV pilus assembly protein PilQ
MTARTIILLGFLLVLGAISCSHLTGEEVGPVTQGAILDRIAVSELADRIRIEVEGGHALTYSVSTSVVPSSVTVELPGLAKGDGLQPLEINTPPLLQVIPIGMSHPRTAVQLVFMLSTPVKPEIRTEQGRLIVEFTKQIGPEVARAAAEEQLEADLSSTPAPQPPPAGATPARTLTKVDVQRGDGEVTVVILGDGAFTYDARPLNSDRVIVDLINVASPIRLQVLPVDHPVLKQIRIGHHSHKVRLVLDLLKPVKYSVQSGSDRLAVRLVAAAEPERVEEPRQAEPREPQAASAAQEDKRVRFVPAGRVPFPERLALIQQTQRTQAPPASGGKAAAPPTDESGAPRYTGRRISLDFQNADIGNVLRLIAEVSGFNIVVGEGVKAKVTIRLVSVPWDQALEILLRMNNLGMIREGSIVWIDTMANIARQQEEEAKVKESKVKAADLVKKVLYVKNVSAQEIQITLQKYLSPRGQLTVNPSTNTLVIQDTESSVAEFTKLVDSLDIEVPQVQIEARIVQADTAYTRSLGIQWGITSRNTTRTGNVASLVSGNDGTFGAQTAQGAQDTNFLINLPAAVSGIAQIPAAGFTFGRLTQDGTALDLRISAGEFLGLTKVIAAPKIITLDKREAKIEQGESIPFQTTSLQGTQTTFVDANLTLQVTPQITYQDPTAERKLVLLKIRATRNAVGARSNPAGPSIDKREATTQVLVRDGETTVIGGIFVDSQINNVAGIPFLSRIPVLGWLFKKKDENVARQELLIFLTPTIVKS